MTNIELGKKYEAAELEAAGYSPTKRYTFESPDLIEKFGKEGIILKREGERLLVVEQDDGLSMVIAQFDPEKEKRARLSSFIKRDDLKTE